MKLILSHEEVTKLVEKQLGITGLELEIKPNKVAVIPLKKKERTPEQNVNILKQIREVRNSEGSGAAISVTNALIGPINPDKTQFFVANISFAIQLAEKTGKIPRVEFDFNTERYYLA